MPGAVGSLVIETRLHPKRWWILVPITVDGRPIQMVLDTGSPLSSISKETFDRLERTGSVRQTSALEYLLSNAVIQGQPIPDLTVRISRRVTRVGAEGVLGLNFLGRFRRVEFDAPTMMLTLLAYPERA
jgi:hypothetical protein